MQHIQGAFHGVRNARIHYQGWLPEGAVRATLIIVHGLGEHCGRYGNLANHLVPLGYALYGLDHIGHGRSEGRREGIERFDDYTDTLRLYVEMVAGWQPGKPLFMLGHSMGGLIAADYLPDHQGGLAGAIFSAPLLTAGDSVSPATILMARVLSALAPRLGVAPLDVTALSRDPQVVERYVNDPLVFHGKTPARLGAELLRAMQRARSRLGELTLPFLAIQGGDDRLVAPAGAQMLYERAGSQDKTLKLYPGLYHELFNEPERALVLDDVANWLAARL
jgi:alpha-beta hydrolase superfamily lysophospholipase